MSSVGSDMTMRTIALAGSLLVLGMAHSAGLARAEEDRGTMLSQDPTQAQVGQAPTEAPATDETPASADEPMDPASGGSGTAGPLDPGASLEEDLTRDADRLTEQIAEQSTLLDTAQTGEERIRIANHIKFLKQELHALQRALQ